MMTSSNVNIFRMTGPFVREIYWWSVDSPHKGQWHGALTFSVICAWTNGWANNRDVSDLRRHCALYDVIVMGRYREVNWWFADSGLGGDVSWWQTPRSLLAKDQACRLFGTRARLEPTLSFCQFDTWEQPSWNYSDFYFTNAFENVATSVQTSMGTHITHRNTPYHCQQTVECSVVPCVLSRVRRDGVCFIICIWLRLSIRLVEQSSRGYMGRCIALSNIPHVPSNMDMFLVCFIWGIMYHKQVSRASIINYIKVICEM